MDWSQKDIVKLYTDIQNNGYKIVYLTARAIGEADATRNYITTLKQDGVNLPDGPIFMSPDDLVKAFLRELYYKEPHKFKIACLKNIKSLFLEEQQPIVAGFGNRDTDAISYNTIGIKNELIFIVNPQGEIYRYSVVGNNTNYLSIDQEVANLFPRLNVK